MNLPTITYHCADCGAINQPEDLDRASETMGDAPFGVVWFSTCGGCGSDDLHEHKEFACYG